MTEEIERIAEEVDACKLPYSIHLTRLVDGESTYELHLNGEVLEFPDTEEAYEHLRDTEAKAKANVIIKALTTARAEARNQALEEARKALRDLEIHHHHIGYDNGPGGGNYVYAEVVILDEADAAIRALIAPAGEEK